jgi:chromate transporter
VTEAVDNLARPSGTAREVLSAFLRLGITSFGGPVAHLGYFREEFVVRRKWLDEQAFGDLIALCQFLPGPASSQVGFSIGLMRAGWRGALAAWTGFTLPSAIALVAFAYGSQAMQGSPGSDVLHGLKLVAVAIVAQAVWGMARGFCPDRERAAIAAIAAIIVAVAPSSGGQVATILFGAVAGFFLLRNTPKSCDESHPSAMPLSRRAAMIAFALFVVLLVGLPVARDLTQAHAVALFEAFYRAGALVFGGGHVVLPLLRETVVAPGFVSDDAFLAGYGAAQAVPGPLFTFAAYLGTLSHPSPNGIPGAALALVGIFLPGMLVLVAALPFWENFRSQANAQALMRGVNAAVVGLLGCALYDPIFVSSVKTHADFGLALAGFVLLTYWRVPPIVIVLLGAMSGALLAIAHG